MAKLFYAAALCLIFVAANASAQQKKNTHAGSQREMKMKYSSPGDISIGTYSKVNPGVVKSKANAGSNGYRKNKNSDIRRIKKLNRLSSNILRGAHINLPASDLYATIYRKNAINQLVSFS